jgi:hypothetical protein
LHGVHVRTEATEAVHGLAEEAVHLAREQSGEALRRQTQATGTRCWVAERLGALLTPV